MEFTYSTNADEDAALQEMGRNLGTDDMTKTFQNMVKVAFEIPIRFAREEKARNIIAKMSEAEISAVEKRKAVSDESKA